MPTPTFAIDLNWRLRSVIVALVLSLFASNNVVAQDSPLDPPQDTLPASWNWMELPLGINVVAGGLANDPRADAKIRLGRRLFFDTILSDDGKMSCASCHRPDHGFASEQPVAIGVRGKPGERNAPTILNRALGQKFFWDGRVASLEEQALLPIESANELASSVDAVLKRLAKDESYLDQFREAFSIDSSDKPNSEYISAANLSAAIASFERTLVVGNSAADQFRASKYDTLSPPQRAGMWIFESRGKCWQCHSGDNFSDEQFHNTGVDFGDPKRDLGRFVVTQADRDRFAMKTPTLRGIAQTAPYMHDGSVATLRQVVEFYNKGGAPDDPNLDQRIRPLGLSESEVEALAAFLEALSPIDPFAR